MHLDDRVHYELPLNHVDFNEIKDHCINDGEDVSLYRHSQDNLLIQVKCYSDCPDCPAQPLTVINEADPNWPVLDDIPVDS
jgi:hypothetical protein